MNAHPSPRSERLSGDVARAMHARRNGSHFGMTANPPHPTICWISTVVGASNRPSPASIGLAHALGAFLLSETAWARLGLALNQCSSAFFHALGPRKAARKVAFRPIPGLLFGARDLQESPRLRWRWGYVAYVVAAASPLRHGMKATRTTLTNTARSSTPTIQTSKVARCIGNDSPHLCLSCGHQFKVDSRAPVAACPKCKSRDIESTFMLGDKTCPNCKAGVFAQDPNWYAIS